MTILRPVTKLLLFIGLWVLPAGLLAVDSEKNLEIPKDYPVDVTSPTSDNPPVESQPSSSALHPLKVEIQRLENSLQKVIPHRQGGISLSFAEAVQLGILNNLRTLTALENLQDAKGEFRQSLAGLLPQLSGKVTQSRRTSNFTAEGIDPSFLPAGFPSGIFGPYNNFDARITLLQSIFDLEAIGDFQAGQSIIRLSKLQVILARQIVSSESALAYIKTLKAESDVLAAQADYELSQTLYLLTKTAFDAGVVTGVDLVRAESNMVTDRTKLIRAKTQAQTTMLGLKEVLLLPMGSEVILTSKLKSTAAPPPPVDQAVAEAEAQRPDVKMANEEIKMRTSQHRAAIGKQLPSIAFGANYGGSGSTPTQGTAGTYQFGGQVSVPLFDGGLTLGQIKSAKSKKRQAQLSLSQLRQQVNKEVRIAIAKLKAGKQEIVAATENLRLTKMEMELTRERFFAGVGDNLEVVKAQTSLASARTTYVEALAGFNSARIQLAFALGEMDGFQL